MAVLAFAATGSVQATIIDTDDLELLASFETSGLYNLEGLRFWNGQPVSPTNKPSDYNRLLEASINFYVDSLLDNVLYVQITDVITTQASWWAGLAFYHVSQTGIGFTLPSDDALGLPSLNDQFANPGQELRFGPPTGSTSPLETTPGYQLSSLADSFLLSTPNTPDFAFSSLGSISNATRIYGGGMFQLAFDTLIDVRYDINYEDVEVASIYGSGHQTIEGVLTYSRPPQTEVPIPATLPLCAIGLSVLGWSRRKKG
jgi:hypothetical protein